jgi:hypothetical protein
MDALVYEVSPLRPSHARVVQRDFLLVVGEKLTCMVIEFGGGGELITLPCPPVERMSQHSLPRSYVRTLTRCSADWEAKKPVLSRHVTKARRGAAAARLR